MVIERLSDERHPVLVLSGAASRGVATQFVIDLGQLRTGVSLLEGNTVDVMRTLALAADPPTIVAIDIRRYDRWVVDTLRLASDARGWIVALTDSVLSPLASMADHAVRRQRRFARAVRQPCRHAGPARRAGRRRRRVRPRPATERLDRLEVGVAVDRRPHRPVTDAQ